jgi:hypothetical protein
MAGKLTKTTTPGIYRRHRDGCQGKCSCPYVAIWRGLRGQEGPPSGRSSRRATGRPLGCAA